MIEIVRGRKRREKLTTEMEGRQRKKGKRERERKE